MYTLKLKRKWIFKVTYVIYFEDTAIREVTGLDYTVVKDFVFLLNTAYSLGFSSGEIVGKLENENV